MTKKLYILVEAQRAAAEAYNNLMESYKTKEVSSEYVEFQDVRPAHKRNPGFDAYFSANYGAR